MVWTVPLLLLWKRLNHCTFLNEAEQGAIRAVYLAYKREGGALIGALRKDMQRADLLRKSFKDQKKKPCVGDFCAFERNVINQEKIAK